MVLTENQKKEIILKYNILNKSFIQISKEMSINRHTVSLWLNRYNNNNCLERKRGSGKKNNVVIKD